MVDAIGRDLNPTAALNEYRENGGSFTTQSWYRLYGEVGASIENQTTAAGLDPYAVPNAGDYTEWSMGQGGGYATSVNVFFRDRDDGSIGYKQYDYITDEPHTPADAAAAAWDDYGDEETQNAYDQTLVGWSVRNVYQTVPWVGRDA
jgi:hypothetical protein